MPIVYKATNRINGNFYIGVAKKTLHRRRRQHEWCAGSVGSEKDTAIHYMPIVRAIKKYGAAAFDWEILETHENYSDALKAEVRLIAELKPKYNITLGGEGTRGHVVSQAQREKARAHGLAHREEIKKRLSSGPEVVSKPVKCLDDGKFYPSLSAAARAYGLSTGALSEHCTGSRKRLSVNGLHFAYVDGSSPPIDRTDSRRMFTEDEIRNIRSAAEYFSKYSIAKIFGVTNSVIGEIVSRKSYAHVTA